MSWCFLEIYKKGILLQGNFFLSHAPKEKNLRYGAKYNIHGHCHSKRKKRYKNVEFFDIGVDGNNFSPYRLQSVQFKMIVRDKLKFLSLHKKQKNDIIL